MDKIQFNENLEFILYLENIANKDFFIKNINKFKKDSVYNIDENILNSYIIFLNENYNFYSFIEKTFIDTFFGSTKIINSYLLFLFFKKYNFEAINNNTFNEFLKYNFNEEVNINTNIKRLILKTDIEFNTSIDKTSNLIFAILSEEDILINFKNDLIKIKEKFISYLINPYKKDIDNKLLEIQNIYKENNEAFYSRIDINKLKEEKINGYYSPYFPFVETIYLKENTFVFGSYIFKTINNIDDRYSILLSKFLSEPKRYKILKLLSSRKYYSNELAKELNLTAATMNYHINKLYDLGLINMEEGKQNKLYIQLNKKRLSYLLDNMKKDLLDN